MPGGRGWGGRPWMDDYNEVRAAGWTFDRARRCWTHTSGVWAACNQTTILGHLRAGTEVPTRDMPPVRSLEVQITADNTLAAGMETVRRAGMAMHQRQNWQRPEPPIIPVEQLEQWASPRVAQAMRAARATPDRGYSKVSEGWAPNYWEA